MAKPDALWTTRGTRAITAAMSRVFVTGIGVVTPVGIGKTEFFRALLEGKSGVADVTLFPTHDLDRSHACEVKGFTARDHLTAGEARRMGRASAFAVAAARLAVEDSGLSSDTLAGPRTSVVIGTTMGEANVLGELESAWIHDGHEAVSLRKLPTYGSTLLPIHVARAFGARGMVKTLPAACAAGNYAIGYAADQIRAGRADIMLTGATEVIERLQYAGFVRLGAVTPDLVRPFDVDRKGLCVGEGAGMLVLESEESMLQRGATPLCEVGGYGLACDAHHITRPHPEGEGSELAMRTAIRSSGLAPTDVDHINAHGTATRANDAVEAKVIQKIFGAQRPLVTSIKSMIGHCMGAASAIEAACCIMTLQQGVIPPTMNHMQRDPECDIEVVANAPKDADVKVVLNNSLAFGGYDAVVCFAKPGVFPETVGRAPRRSA